MNTPHVSRFTFHASRFTFHVLCFLCAALLIGIADEARADLPDLGFSIITSDWEGRGELVECGYAMESFRDGLFGQVAGEFGLVAGQYDTIWVLLTNFGASEVQEAVVRFYEEGAPEEDRSPIGADVTIARMEPWETVILQKAWDTLGRSGLNRISIQIDPDGQIEESDETNNTLNFERTVHLLGDFNQDGRIDPLDRTILTQALDSGPSDVHWNPVCDIWTSSFPIPDPPNIRPQPDGMADHSDHVVFDRLMDLDLKSALAGIAFDHSEHVVFKVGDEIQISVNFPTVGSAEVGELIVKFFDGPPDAGGTFIGESLISSAFGGLGKAEIVWRTDGLGVGTHRIFTVADPDNQKVESSEENNVLSTNLKLDSTEVNDPDPPLPGRFLLMQNSPNPFNAGTVIPFEITQPDDADIRIVICDNLGREVYTQKIYASHQGRGCVAWDGSDHSGRAVSSGVYFYRLMINEKLVGAARSMVILR